MVSKDRVRPLASAVLKNCAMQSSSAALLCVDAGCIGPALSGLVGSWTEVRGGEDRGADACGGVALPAKLDSQLAAKKLADRRPGPPEELVVSVELLAAVSVSRKGRNALRAARAYEVVKEFHFNARDWYTADMARAAFSHRRKDSFPNVLMAPNGGAKAPVAESHDAVMDRLLKAIEELVNYLAGDEEGDRPKNVAPI